MKSKKSEFEGGIWGLNAIESHLRLVRLGIHLWMRPKWQLNQMDLDQNGEVDRFTVGQIVVKDKRFAKVRKHAKVYTLLSDTTVAAEL